MNNIIQAIDFASPFGFLEFLAYKWVPKKFVLDPF